jgi:serine protease Do
MKAMRLAVGRLVSPRLAMGVLLAFSCSTSCFRSQQTAVAAPPAPAPALDAQQRPPAAASFLPQGASIADVAERVTPSVVNVFSEKVAQAPDLSPFFSDPFFRFFFDEPGRGFREVPRRREQSLGSGVIVSADGVIITNNHVVAQAEKIRVALKDGREFDAKLVGSDPKSDVAVLRIDAKDLPAIPVADSSKLRIGDLVLAIGNPFGIGQTVTMGIVSAVGRANVGITDYEDFIQTDAAINPGNSGGALVNMEGQLVGINTAIVSRSGGYQGIGFAIPSNMAMQVKDMILQHGRVVRGWLGVAIQDITEPLAKSLDVPVRAGVLVSDVSPDGPAAKAGLKRGDVITAIDGVKTTDTGHLRNLVAMAGKGKTVKVELLRDGKTLSVDVVLGEQPAEGVALGSRQEGSADSGALAGITVQELDAAARSRVRAPPTLRGVLVTQVDPQSPAGAMGLRPFDVIVEVNRVETPNVDAFYKAARKAQQRALLLVYRDGFTLFLAISR